jgi:hypothetical protein
VERSDEEVAIITFNTPITGGSMGTAFRINASATLDSTTLDPTVIQATMAADFGTDDPWTYNASLSSLTFAGGATCPSQSGSVA